MLLETMGEYYTLIQVVLKFLMIFSLLFVQFSKFWIYLLKTEKKKKRILIVKPGKFEVKEVKETEILWYSCFSLFRPQFSKFIKSY